MRNFDWYEYLTQPIAQRIWPDECLSRFDILSRIQEMYAIAPDCVRVIIDMEPEAFRATFLRQLWDLRIATASPYATNS